MLFFETKFYFSLGKRNYNRAINLIKEYLEKRGETAKYYEYCFNYYYEINDYEQALDYFVKLVNKKTVSLKFENWIIDFFVGKQIISHQYTIAAKNAMKIAHLENLSTSNRVQLLRMLDYVKTKI